MEFKQGTAHYSIGDPLMDAYPHVFFKTIQDLGSTLAELSPQAAKERIAFLVNHAVMHFESEEELMQQVAFPELENRRVLHRDFRERLSAIQEHYRIDPSTAIAEELLELSQAWLSQHILVEDMKYKDYVKH